MINLNSAFEDELYFEYLKDPDSVGEEWKNYFERVHGKSVFVVGNKPIPSSEVETDGIVAQAIGNSNYAYMNSDAITDWSGFSSQDANHIREMIDSLEVPSATSSRVMAVKALDENRRIINRYHFKLRKPRISFTHLLAWAIIKGIEKFPRINDSFEIRDGKPYRIKKDAINVGLAVDITTKAGTRLLLIPCLKNVQSLSFYEFVVKFNDLLDRARSGKLEYNDLTDVSVTLMNPGMIGTTMSQPRLFKGQGSVISTGLIDYPTELQAMRPDVLTKLAVSKVVNITNTYDHRIIQGAEAAEFLAYMNKLLLGYDQFYEQIFYSLSIPFEPIKWEKDSTTDSFSFTQNEDDITKGAYVMQMINAYRVRGHLLASINPLGFENYYYPELDPAYYGFTIWDLDKFYHADNTWEKSNLPLRDIIELLRETYCGSAGIEFMHIQSPEIKDWIKQKLESTRNTIEYSREEKIQTLKKLIDAEYFENYLHTKFIGHKRFSLEGGEAFMIFLDKVIHESADKDIDTVVIGMAHRGRLNVLVNCVGKPYVKMFNEFEGYVDKDSYQGSGDVKYHLGEIGVYTTTSGNSCRVMLSSNPSHLELVNPVVEGIARAIENEIDDKTYYKALPVLVHGDAAFAGQGIVAETLNLSQLEGYKTGGTVHIVINNQIGFTTSSKDSRSSQYATDVAKMIQAPIIHVNGNDPEAVRTAAAFAFEFRAKFKSDVVVDMLCYRKYGHNEGDEPSYTQPLLYKKIRQMTNVAKIYEEQLLQEGVITQSEIDAYYEDLKGRLDDAFARHKEPSLSSVVPLKNKDRQIYEDLNTRVPKEDIIKIGNALAKEPENFLLNPKIKSLLKRRGEIIAGEFPIDWAMGELLGLGSVLLDGKEVRFSGQDSRRGTFSHRHAVYTDYDSEDTYTPLNNIQPNQAVLRIFDSPLSELAVQGFEYGYSVQAKSGLTIWEAQFGDFANNAQTMVDQYISCSEVKWGVTSNLTILLPHSYDGQGPEHSSGRIERYLQMCAENNMFVCNFTTPANYFHALRRQSMLDVKMPMVIFTPKSMLRNHLAISSIEDLTNGKFEHIIDDKTVNKKNARKLLITSGKLYYEIYHEREKQGIDDVPIIRVEQYYPFNTKMFLDIVNQYTNVKEIAWVQEEPKNQGAWMFISDIFRDILGSKASLFKYIGRRARAATSTGYHMIHELEQSQIVSEALS